MTLTKLEKQLAAALKRAEKAEKERDRLAKALQDKCESCMVIAALMKHYPAGSVRA